MSLKIAVCIKQVPKNKIQLNEKTGNINRAEDKKTLNIYDYSAIETALRIKKMVGGEVILFSMGPESAKEVLREGIGLGADKGYLLSDRKFSGADVLSTATTLLEGIKLIDDFDIIICGKQTTDGDTAQVAGTIAGVGKLNYLPWVEQIIDVAENEINVNSSFDDKKINIKTNFPCVMSVLPSIYQVRVATLMGKMKGKKAEIELIDLEKLKVDENVVGQKGAPTKVVKLYTQKYQREIEVISPTNEEILEIISQNIRQVK